MLSVNIAVVILALGLFIRRNRQHKIKSYDFEVRMSELPDQFANELQYQSYREAMALQAGEAKAQHQALQAGEAKAQHQALQAGEAMQAGIITTTTTTSTGTQTEPEYLAPTAATSATQQDLKQNRKLEVQQDRKKA